MTSQFADPKEKRQAIRILALNTFAFTVCFAVWMMNGVLITFLNVHGVHSWDPSEIGWMIGVPVLTGAIFRLPMYGFNEIPWQSPSRRRCSLSPMSNSSGMNDLSVGLATDCTSGCVPAATCAQEGHSLQGSSASSGLFWHNSARASIHANVRLPTPAGPTNKKLLANRPRASARRNCSTTSSCPKMPCQDMGFQISDFRFRI